MNFLIFLIDIYINTIFEKNDGYNCATVSLITWKILVCDMES